MGDSDGSGRQRSVLLIALVLLTGIVVPGLARRALGVAGYSNLGRAVFVLGYGLMVVILWYVWIRPLDLTGPSGR